MQHVVQTSQSRLSSSEELKLPITLEVRLFFHGLSFVKCIVRQKIVRALLNATVQSKTTIETVIQMILKASSALYRVARLTSLSKVIAPCIKINRHLVWYIVLYLRVNGFAPIAQSKALEYVTDPSPFWRGKIRTLIGEQVNKKGIPLRHETLFHILHEAIGNNAEYRLGTNWSHLNNFQMPGSDDTLRIVFATLQNTVVRELGVERPVASGPEGISLENASCVLNKSVIYSLPDKLAQSKGAGKMPRVVKGFIGSPESWIEEMKPDRSRVRWPAFTRRERRRRIGQYSACLINTTF